MHVSARSYLISGVAFVGAGAIALTPIQPVVPALQPIAAPAPAVSSSAVELSALVNPIALWADAIAGAVGNAGALATTVLEDPAPILRAVLRNQLAAGTTLVDVLGPVVETLIEGIGQVPQNVALAVRKILQGEIFQGIGDFMVAFISPIAGAMLPLLFSGGLTKITEVLQNPFDNISRAIGTIVSPTTLVQLGLPLLTELMAPVLQVGYTIQSVFDGFKAGNLEAVVNAIISLPSDLFNTILNGSAIPEIGNAGLLGENGLLAGLLGLRKNIADVLTPVGDTEEAAEATIAADEPLPSANDIPDPATNFVNVSLDPDPLPPADIDVAGDAATTEEEIETVQVTSEELTGKDALAGEPGDGVTLDETAGDEVAGAEPDLDSLTGTEGEGNEDAGDNAGDNTGGNDTSAPTAPTDGADEPADNDPADNAGGDDAGSEGGEGGGEE